MIEFKNVAFQYGKSSASVLNQLSFVNKDSESLVVLGRNGVGKTTLLRCLTGDLRTYIGEILLNGREIRTYKTDELAREVAIVASNNPSYQNLTVADYLITGFASAKVHPGGSADDMLYEKAYATIKELRKEGIFNKSVNQLSAGEMQLVRIARAILQNPKVIVFDEPTSNLDVENQLMVIEHLSELKSRGYTIVTTTHNPGHAIELGGQVLMLFPEGCYMVGEMRHLITDENMETLYGISASIQEDGHRTYAVFQSSDGKHTLYF